MMKPERLERTSVDGSKLNLEALYQIAPSCFTEEKDEKTGAIKHVVDFKKLRQLLGDDAVDDSEEMYQFTWPGKQAARREAATPITDTLRPVPEDSVDWDTTQNLYIEGDNLRVLKLLQKGYMGKVKMIYIDPPYNTGNDFVYHDDFAHTAEEEELAAGNVDEEGNRYRKNLGSNGRFHSDWCSMMYSRLLVARSLLTEDGVIFISIDDNEVHNLRKVCDEIFGEVNFIENYVWESTFRPDNSSPIRRTNAEHVLLYAKAKSEIKVLVGTTKQSQGLPSLTKKSMKISKLSFKEGIVRTLLKDGIYRAGERESGYTLHNDVEVKDGIIQTKFSISGRVIWGQEYLDNEISKGTEIIIKSDGFVPYSKKSMTTSAPNTIIPREQVGDVLAGRAEVSNLFGVAVFDYPKPISLISYFAEIIDSHDALILDFFSGSATTAHAVMQLNAEDGGNRKYICVQLAEETPEDSEARKAGYATIPEIAKERIRRAGKKIVETLDDRDKTLEGRDKTLEGRDKTLEGRDKTLDFGEALTSNLSASNLSPLTSKLDTGFRVFRLSDSNYEDVTKQPSEYDQDMLDLFADNIKADRTDLDLLFGAMLSWGVQLSLPMTTEEVDGCKIYTVNGNGLVACFAENVTENVVKAMAAKNPLRVLFRDSCFGEDKTKINIFELFKQQLDWDESESMQNIRVI